jgi:hypothetical protein
LTARRPLLDRESPAVRTTPITPQFSSGVVAV